MPEPTAAPRTGAGMLGQTIRRQGRRLMLAYPLLIGWQLGEALTPVVIGLVVDHGIAGHDLGSFLLWLGVLAALMAGFSLAYRFGGRLGFRSVQEESHTLRDEIGGHVLDPRGADTDQLPGEVLSLATADADMTGVVVRQFGFALGSLTAVIVIGVWLLWTDWVIGALVLLGMPLTVALTQLLAPAVARRTTSQQATIARAAGVASDLMAGLRPLKGVRGEDVAARRYARASLEAQRASITMARSWGVLSGVSSGLSTLFLGIVAAVAGLRALDDAITLGQFIAVVGVAQYLAEPIVALGELTAQAAASLASGARISRFLHTPALVADGSVDLGTPADRLTVEELDLTVKGDDLVTIVSDDPAFDGALIDMLHGTRPSGGRILLGGQELLALSIASRRTSMLVVDHGADLFEGSVLDAMDPDRELSAAQLDAVLDASAAHDVVAAHEDGLDHQLRASGGTLSGGQRQRLVLARSLAADAPVLVLHDPTSAVDAVTEQRIAAGLRSMRAGRATLVLTSSPALLDTSDEVVIVRDGRVVDRGTHRDLLARDEAYRQAVIR